MSKQDSGERAFPFFDRTTMNTPEFGMSLRDYFAAKAMQAHNSNPYWDNHSFAQIAKVAYQQADAMLLERDK